MSNATLNRIWVPIGALLVVVAFALFSPVLAQPVTQDKKSNGQFVGIALVTDNAQWYRLFERPEPPHINGKSSFKPGESGAIAVIFAGAENRNGRVTVECSVTAIGVDGKRKKFPAGICYDGPARPPGILYPSLLDLRFTIAAQDPRGISTFEIGLRDKVSGRGVTLKVSLMQDTAI